MGWDTLAALQFIRSHASSASHNRCAEYTRRAVEAGGVRLERHADAKDYGRSLKQAGFIEIQPGMTLIAGDVVVIQPYSGGNPSGHMAMFDGQRWYSDFLQRTMYPGPGYRQHQPPYQIYRMN